MEITTYRDYNDLMIIIEHETKSWCTYDILLNWFLIRHYWINLTSMIALFSTIYSVLNSSQASSVWKTNYYVYNKLQIDLN